MPLGDFLLDVAYGNGTKRVKFNENEDRISDLPDSIIHHILSFLPSTKQAVQTGILSKRWRYQWTRVPVLSFDDRCMTNGNYLKFVEYTLMLHECLKIKKFCLSSNFKDPQFATKIRFATTRHVEELYLASLESLPMFLFNHAALVKLTTIFCTVMPNEIVNWRCLSELKISDGNLTDQAVKHILSGSPSLKSLNLWQACFDKLVIASKSLKRLDLDCICFSTIDISCPSLEKLSLGVVILDFPGLFAQAIENILSSSSLLESFELWDHCNTLQLPKLVIASKSLKSLVLRKLREVRALEISCPELEKLNFCHCLFFQTPKLVNLPSSLCVTISLFYNLEDKLSIHMIKDILESLKYFKQLELGSSFIKHLSDIAIEEGHCRFVPRLNVKCLILYSDGLNKYHYGIACILDNSTALEELIIEGPKYNEGYDYSDRKLNACGEKFWSSNTTVFNCLVSHLKTIKINGFPCRDHNRKLVLNFVQFLLNNAKVLEKMVVELKDREYETTFILKVSQELLSLSKCSPYAKIECYALSK